MFHWLSFQILQQYTAWTARPMMASSIGMSMEARWKWNNLAGLLKLYTNQKKPSAIVRIVWVLLSTKRKWTVITIFNGKYNEDCRLSVTHRWISGCRYLCASSSNIGLFYIGGGHQDGMFILKTAYYTGWLTVHAGTSWERSLQAESPDGISTQNGIRINLPWDRC